MRPVNVLDACLEAWGLARGICPCRAWFPRNENGNRMVLAGLDCTRQERACNDALAMQAAARENVRATFLFTATPPPPPALGPPRSPPELAGEAPFLFLSVFSFPLYSHLRSCVLTHLSPFDCVEDFNLGSLEAHIVAKFDCVEDLGSTMVCFV